MAIWFCLLNIGYMTYCKTSKLSCSPPCRATLFLHLFLSLLWKLPVSYLTCIACLSSGRVGLRADLIDDRVRNGIGVHVI